MPSIFIGFVLYKNYKNIRQIVSLPYINIYYDDMVFCNGGLNWDLRIRMAAGPAGRRVRGAMGGKNLRLRRDSLARGAGGRFSCGC